jgi:hypothetical protein
MLEAQRHGDFDWRADVSFLGKGFLIKTNISLLSPIIPPLEEVAVGRRRKKHKKTDPVLPLSPSKGGFSLHK